MKVENLATELDVDPATIYNWMRGECQPSIPRAFAIIEVAQRFGTKLSLEDIYTREANTDHDEEKSNAGILPRTASEARNRRLATATK
jgi:DNA-binding XRE family transcriptional regulator